MEDRDEDRPRNEYDSLPAPLINYISMGRLILGPLFRDVQFISCRLLAISDSFWPTIRTDLSVDLNSKAKHKKMLLRLNITFFVVK